MDTIPYIQVRNNSLVCYRLTENRQRSETRVQNMLKQRDQRYSGTVTAGVQKRIRKAIDLLIQTSTLRNSKLVKRSGADGSDLVFITLTIPDDALDLTGVQAHKLLLEPFLRSMRRRQKMDFYIWKLERQERGTLHYHITTNRYIAHTQIRKVWNELLDKAGLMETYKRQFGNNNPNSTDVHQVYQCENIEAYLSKYLSKSDQNIKPADGKVWDCSLNLKSAKRFSMVQDSFFDDRLLQLERTKKVEVLVGDRFEIVKGKRSDLNSLLTLEQLRELDLHLKSLRKFKRRSPTAGCATLRRPSVAGDSCTGSKSVFHSTKPKQTARQTTLRYVCHAVRSVQSSIPFAATLSALAFPSRQPDPR